MPKIRKELEWNVEKVPKSEWEVAWFHESLREANLAEPYDRPWMGLKENERKALAEHYRNLIRRRTHLSFTAESKPNAKMAKRPVRFKVNDIDAVRISWWAYTDQEILQAVTSWLKRNRPKTSKATNQGKKDNSHLTRLERFAIARLLSVATKDELLSDQSARGAFFRSRSKYLPQDKTRLKEYFFKLFPLLKNANQEPRCLLNSKK